MTATEAPTAAASGPGRIWRFGGNLLDEKERQLTVGDRRVALSPKAFDLLVLLVERNGRLVRREELMDLLWPQGLVEDGTLARYVSDVRKALGADATCVETVPKSGYRFTANVEQVDPHIDGRPGPSNDGRKRRRVRIAIIAAFFVVVLSVTSLLALRLGFPVFASPPESIAVLPFQTIGAPLNDEHLEMGLADVLIARLSTIPDLEIRSLSAVAGYAGRTVDSLVAGRTLGVDAVLEGTLRRRDGRLRVSARLISVADGHALWAGSFDHADVDLLAVEEAIGREATLVIAPSLLKEGSARRTPIDVQAHELYLRGRYFWGKRTTITNRKAVELFDAALARDPNYAQAEAGLAAAYALMAGLAEPPELYDQARRHAERALILDPRLADARAVLGIVAQNYDGDWALAEREYRNALEIQPNHSTTHHWFGEMLALLGRFDEGITLLERAAQLDPLSLAIASDIAKANYFARRWELAIARGEQVLAMDSQYAWAWAWVGGAELELGHIERALECLTRFEELEPSPFASALRIWALVAAGRGEEAESVLGSLESATPERYVTPVALAMGRLALGDKKGAMDALEILITSRQNRVGISTSPIFESLRAEPRYLELMRRANLVPTPP